jgi:uncharacterized membrane protein
MTGRSILTAWSHRPARIVAVVGLTAGLAFALLSPPLAGYDESIHFLRAYQVSEGGLVATHHGHVLGGSVPRDLPVDLGRLLTGGLYSHHDRTAFLARLGDPPPGGPKVFVDFASGAVYSPVVYAPAAVPMAIGRAFGASTLLLLYLGRIGSLLAAVGLLARAVRRMPTRAWMLATVAMLPVTVFQAAMLSADGITIALALLVLALALDAAATPRGGLSRGRLAEIALATVALGLAKPPYILFALAFAIPWRRHGGTVARALVAAVGAGFAATAAWGAYASSVYEPPRLPPGYAGPVTRYTVFTHVDPHRQERFVLQHPWHFTQTVARTLSAYWSDFVREAVAQVPLWTVPATLVVAALVIVAVATTAPDEARPLETRPGAPVLGWRSRVLLLAIAASTFSALMVLAYVGWNAYQSPRIEAFQGRYLLPLVPLLLLTLPAARTPERRGPGLGLALGSAASIVLAAVWFGLRSHFY